MYKVATVYEVRSDEKESLLFRLKANDFTVGDGMHDCRIYHKDMQPGQLAGHLDKWYDKSRLHVLEVPNNPLEKFVQEYIAPLSDSAPSPPSW